jgi:hypothetical protein
MWDRFEVSTTQPRVEFLEEADVCKSGPQVNSSCQSSCYDIIFYIKTFATKIKLDKYFKQ